MEEVQLTGAHDVYVINKKMNDNLLKSENRTKKR